MTLKDASTILERVYKTYEPSFVKTARAHEDLANDEEIQTQLFNGGRRDFSDLKSIQSHYAAQSRELRSHALPACDAMAVEMEKEIESLYSLDVDAVSETQTLLSACSSNDDVKRLAVGANGSYSVLSTIAAFDADNDASFARTVGTALDRFKTSLSRSIQNFRDYAGLAAKGDKYGDADSFTYFCESEIEHVADAYADMTATLDGTGGTGGSAFLDYLAGKSR